MTLFSFGLGWLWSIFSSFWFWLDRSIYDLIGGLYDILISISRVSILSQGTIQEVSSRIQIFLGVFMLFKVSFSLIMYVINPDDFTDKSKGVSKLAVNTIISLVMLAVIPYIFNMAFRLQGMILDDNTLARIVFGDGKDNTQSSSEDEEGFQYSIIDGGEKIKYQIMIPFFQPDTSVRDELAVCSTLKKSNGKFNKDCLKKLKEFSEEEDHDYIENYRVGVEQGSFGLTFRLDTINTTVKGSNNEDYLFSYKWPITTVCGVVVCLLLISFCIDIATRAVKLSFLQLIAPVPIISYMDPKSGKDGLFGKWAKMCGTTYVSLFVRLLVLYLGIFIISNIDDLVDVVDDSKVTDPIVKVFIIIGVLFFMKQLPQILNNLGIKLDGDGKFTLNPFKKMEEGMAGYGAIKKAAIGAGVAGLAGGAALGANALTSAQRIKDAKGKKKIGQIFRMPFSMLTGATSASYRGLKGGLKGGKFGETYKSSYGKAMENKKSRADRVDENVGWTEMLGARARDSIGLHSRNEATEAAQKHIKNINEAYDTMRSQAEAMDKDNFKASDFLSKETDQITGNEELNKFKQMDFNGIKDLSKFKEQISAPLKQKDGESDADFLERQHNHKKFLDAVDEVIDTRINRIADGQTKISHKATEKAITDAYETMKREQAAFNETIGAIDEKVGKIDGSDAKTINGTAKGAKARLDVSEVAQHEAKVAQYASNKDQK